MAWSYRSQTSADEQYHSDPGPKNLSPDAVRPSVSYNFYYDFVHDGGAVGDVTLRGDEQLPNNFIVDRAYIDIQTALDSAAHTATGALSTGQTADDLKAATVVSNAFWTDTGPKSITILSKTSAARSPKLTIAVQALNAGKFTLHIEGYAA